MNIKELEKYLGENKKTHLVFDFDHTLFALEYDREKIREEIGRAYEKIDKDFGWKAGEKVTPWINRYIKEYGEPARKMLLESYRKGEKDFSRCTGSNDELIRFIKESSYKLYLWTNNTRKFVEGILSQYGLLDRFTLLVTRDEVKFIKPDSCGFELIRDPKVGLGEYLIIGDSKDDEGAAKNAGVDFFKIEHDWKS